jgi:hypothetical protein
MCPSSANLSGVSTRSRPDLAQNLLGWCNADSFIIALLAAHTIKAGGETEKARRKGAEHRDVSGVAQTFNLYTRAFSLSP